MKLADAYVNVDMQLDSPKNKSAMKRTFQTLSRGFIAPFRAVGGLIKNWATPLASALHLAGKITQSANAFEQKFKGYQKMAVDIANYSKLTGGDPLRFGALEALASPFGVEPERLATALKQSLITIKDWKTNDSAPVSITGGADPISTLLSVLQGVSGFSDEDKAQVLNQLFGEVGIRLVSLAKPSIFKDFRNALAKAQSLGVTSSGLRTRGEQIAKGDVDVFLNKLAVASSFSKETFDVGTQLDLERVKRDLRNLGEGGIGINILKAEEQMSILNTHFQDFLNILAKDFIPFIKNIRAMGFFKALDRYLTKVAKEEASNITSEFGDGAKQ